MGPESLRGPHNDIVTTLDNTGVTPYQQRRANNLFYSLLDKIAQEAEDPILRMEQLMIAFPAYAEAVGARRKKGHKDGNIARDSTYHTMRDIQVHSAKIRNAWLKEISDYVKMRHALTIPISEDEKQIERHTESPNIKDMLRTIANDDITFEP